MELKKLTFGIMALLLVGGAFAGVLDYYGKIEGTADVKISPNWVGWWRFNEGEGDTVYDDSSYGNNGTINGASWTKEKDFGYALEFDGSDDYVEVADDPSLDIGTTGLTVTAWVYLKDDFGSSWMVYDKGTSQAGTYYLYSDTAGNFRMTVKNGTDRFDATASDSIVPQNEWVFLTGTYNGSTVKLWKDASEIASASAPADLGSNDQPFTLGYYQGGGYYFNGKIDEVRIFNVSLSQDQVSYIYHSTCGDYNGC